MLFAILLSSARLVAQVKPAITPSPSPTESFDNAPTYIDAAKLVLFSEKRFFEYTGGVTVRRADVTITSERVVGDYTEKNEIKTITAHGKVKIEKTTGIVAYGEHATYDAATEKVVLTENPSVEQNGSILSADIITVYLKEDRSEASGDVKVKLMKQGAGAEEMNKIFKR